MKSDFMLDEISIYIHIPFCKSKCFYCDFTSYCKKEEYFEIYKNMLLNEIEKSNFKKRTVKSIFFGGGTPSVFPEEYIDEILNKVYKQFNIKKDAEITIEANPGTLNLNKLKYYKKIGINRISVGLQCWQDKLLKMLGRIHTKEEFLNNFYNIRNAGFNNVNIDLMFSLPNQTIKDWIETLENIINLQPEHISCYSLIIEEGTPFFDMFQNKKFVQTSEGDDRIMYYKACELLTYNSYKHYEISNFAKNSFECIHNMVYWKCYNYLGFGIAAHSFVDGVRFNNTYNLNDYINGKTIVNKEFIKKNDSYAEFMFLGLRMIEGISKSEFYNRFNISIDNVYQNQLKKLSDKGLLILNGDNIRLTKKGIDVSNSVFVEFI